MSYTNRTFSVAKKSFDDYSLVYLTWSRYENDWPSTMHFHSFTEFMYIVSGTGTLHLDGSSQPLREGDLVVICPSTPHTETSQTKNCLEYYIFAVENISFENADTERVGGVFHLNIDDLDDRRALLQRFKRAESELTNQKLYYEVYVQSLINETLVYILRKIEAKDVKADNLNVPSECAFVKRYIDLHFSEKITLDEIARKTFFSKFYIIHSFKKQYGTTPIQYLLDKRLTEAASLLENTNLSVTDITIGVGFSSASQLAKAFREKYGLTPQQYRARTKRAGSLINMTPPPQTVRTHGESSRGR